MPAATIADHFHSRARFIAALVAAELNACNSWEFEFTNSLRERFEKWGNRTALSVTQAQQLRRIAGE